MYKVLFLFEYNVCMHRNEECLWTTLYLRLQMPTTWKEDDSILPSFRAEVQNLRKLF